jgi:hypothetical protein
MQYISIFPEWLITRIFCRIFFFSVCFHRIPRILLHCPPISSTSPKSLWTSIRSSCISLYIPGFSCIPCTSLRSYCISLDLFQISLHLPRIFLCTSPSFHPISFYLPQILLQLPYTFPPSPLDACPGFPCVSRKFLYVPRIPPHLPVLPLDPPASSIPSSHFPAIFLCTSRGSPHTSLGYHRIPCTSPRSSCIFPRLFLPHHGCRCISHRWYRKSLP